MQMGIGMDGWLRVQLKYDGMFGILGAMEGEKPKLQNIVIERMLTIVLGGLGLVAALAWNDAIQSLFTEIFGSQGILIAKFGYAFVVTIIITIVSIRLLRYAGKNNFFWGFV